MLRKTAFKVLKSAAFLLICFVSLCGQECDPAVMDAVSGILKGAGLGMMASSNEDVKVAGALLNLASDLFNAARPPNANYDPGLRDNFEKLGYVTTAAIVKSEPSGATVQEVPSGTTAQNNRNDQAPVFSSPEPAQFQLNQVQRGSSSVTQNSGQNTGDPQVNKIAAANRRVAQGRDPRLNNNRNRNLTPRDNTFSNAGTGSAASRAQAANDARSRPGRWTPNQGRPPAGPGQANPGANTARAASTTPTSPAPTAPVAPPPPRVVDDIVKFTPKPQNQTNQNQNPGTNTPASNTPPNNTPRPGPGSQAADYIVRGINWSDPKASITRNLTVREATFLPSWGIFHIPSAGEIDNIIELAAKVQNVRDAYNKPITVNVWIRPKSVNPGALDSSGKIIKNDSHSRKGQDYNAFVKGASGSPHVSGIAVDIRDADRSLTDFLLKPEGQNLLEANSLWMEDENTATTWVHLDTFKRNMAGREYNRRRIFKP